MQLIIANKAQFSDSLPGLLVAKYVELKVSGASVETVFEDVEKLNLNGKEAFVILKTEDGQALADDEAIFYMRDTYEPLQVGSKEKVREHHRYICLIYFHPHCVLRDAYFVPCHCCRLTNGSNALTTSRLWMSKPLRPS